MKIRICPKKTQQDLLFQVPARPYLGYTLWDSLLEKYRAVIVSPVLVFDKKDFIFLILSGVQMDINSWFLSETDWVTTDRKSLLQVSLVYGQIVTCVGFRDLN